MKAPRPIKSTLVAPSPAHVPLARYEDPDSEADSGADSRKLRADGVEARERLLHAALRLFAEQGYEKTSTRSIALAAGINIASIKYYFGDKAGLYRAVFTEPLGSARDDIPFYDQPHFTLQQSLEGFFRTFLEPLRLGDLAQWCVRLHFREMLEPTGVWAEEIDNGIKPAHAALVRVLCRHLKVRKADDDMHRLVFAITGLALQIFVARDVIQAIRPKLFATPAALDEWVARLVTYAHALVDAEAIRRAGQRRTRQPS